MFSRAQLLAIRDRSCVGLPRVVKRKLFKLRIRRVDHVCVNESFQCIPVRISNRTDSNWRSEKHFKSQRLESSNLRKIRRLSSRARKPRPFTPPSLVLTNARSVKNKLDEISLRLKQLRPTLMLITESWLDDSIDNNCVNMPSYRILRRDRNSMGGGILAYYSENVKIEECSCLDINLQGCKSEILLFFLHPGNIMVVVLYHPYWGNATVNSQVIDCLVDIVAHGHEHHSCRSLLICGDFNGLSDCVDEINSLLGTFSLFVFPTRENAQLDHVLCDTPQLFKEAQCFAPLGKSDHSLVFCDVLAVPPPPSVTKIQTRAKSPSACATFKAELDNSSFLLSIMEMTDVNAASNALIQYLVFLFNKHFPLRSVRLKSDDKPWIKPSVKLLINKRDSAYAKGKMGKYLRLRKAVILLSKKLKHNFLLAATKSKNPSKLWRAIKNVASQASSCHSI